MHTGFLSYSASEQQRIHEIFQPVYEIEKSGTASLDELLHLNVALLKTELEKNKEDAFIWSLFGDHLDRIKESVKALDSYKKSHKLEPNNPRTVFQLASCYNKLAMARIVAHPKYSPLAELSGPFFDPINSKKRLQEIRMSEEEAAQQSWDLFFQVLDMDISQDERAHVLATTVNLKKLYPHLKVPKSYKSGKRNLLLWICLIPFLYYLLYYLYKLILYLITV